jgi:hypothetical protein
MTGLENKLKVAVQEKNQLEIKTSKAEKQITTLGKKLLVCLFVGSWVTKSEHADQLPLV